MSSKLESDVCCRLQVAPSVKATEVTAGLAESNGSLLPGLWSDSLHVTCGLTACTPGSAPGSTLGNEYGKTLPFFTQVSRYQKGKTNLDFTEARDSVKALKATASYAYQIPNACP